MPSSYCDSTSNFRLTPTVCLYSRARVQFFILYTNSVLGVAYTVSIKLPKRPKDQDEKMAIDGFVDTMHKLLHTPENFVVLVSGLVETMNRWLSETKTMEFLACLLFEEVIIILIWGGGTGIELIK